MMTNTKLTREQKRRLAMQLLHAAGNLVEFQTEYTDIADLDPGAMKEQLTIWLQKLPGDRWDMRLPLPEDV